MRYLLVLGLLSGCFDGGTSVRERPLAGTQWQAEVSGVECYILAGFPDTTHYTAGLGCQLNDGSIGLQVEAGTYGTYEGYMATTALESSCPASEVTIMETSSYRNTGTTLTLENSTGVIVFTRVYPDGSSGGTVPFGCFDSAGIFTPRPVQPL